MKGTRRRLALVVPNLAAGGGVQAVGRFLARVAAHEENLDLRLISLSESARDPASLRLASPESWLTGHGTTSGELDGIPFVHVGAVGGEMEFQRYRPRPALTDVVSDCDLVQVVGGSAAWANAVTGLGKPVSLHVATRALAERRQRDAQASTPAELWRKGMTTITDRLDDRALRTVDAIQVMNPWMLEYARSLNTGRDVDIRLLSPGVDAEHFRPLQSGRSASDRYVLCVARLGDPRKNLGLLLEAYGRLSSDLRRDMRLVLAGPPPLPDAVWAHADRLGIRDCIQVIENPDAPELLRLYQNASVFALSSDEEGFGMVLLEAMACGVPVVSTRSGGPDGIVTDGEDGYLVPRDDATALSHRLAQLLASDALAAAMGARARRTIEQRFDAKVVGRSFVDIWQQLVPA